MTCSRGCCESFKEHISSVAIASAATPSRSRKVARAGEPKNSWERGEAKDHRNMPYLDAGGSPIGVHEWQSRRSSFTESLRKEAQTSKE